MQNSQITEINNSLLKTNRAIVALGCSFVDGQGAVDDLLYERYTWEYKDLGYPLEIIATTQELQDLMREYPVIASATGKPNFQAMEQNNAFVNVLCNKYFDRSWTAINLGMRGKGNRASVTDLLLRVEIDWSLVKECIVIYCPSGPERFDFINDQFMDHIGRYECMWPHTKDSTDAREPLWRGYKDLLWSEKFGVLEQLVLMQQLKLWCQVHNAKMIITPGFDYRYTQKHFVNCLNSQVNRDLNRVFIKEDQGHTRLESVLIGQWPWEAMFEPDGYKTFADLTVAQDPHLDKAKANYFFEFYGKGSPGGWITKCAHPAAKGHDYFAKVLHKHIVSNLL